MLRQFRQSIDSADWPACVNLELKSVTWQYSEVGIRMSSNSPSIFTEKLGIRISHLIVTLTITRGIIAMVIIKKLKKQHI